MHYPKVVIILLFLTSCVSQLKSYDSNISSDYCKKVSYKKFSIIDRYIYDHIEVIDSGLLGIKFIKVQRDSVGVTIFSDAEKDTLTVNQYFNNKQFRVGQISKNTPVGRWFTYDSTGKLLYFEDYIDGRPMFTSTYNNNCDLVIIKRGSPF